MSGARATRHSIAIGAAALIVLATAVGSVQAASPRPVPLDQLRPARHAWDLPAAEDPGRLIVTFRPGTSTRSRRAAIGGAGATTDADLGASLSVGVRARSGTAAATLSTLQADERVLQVSIDHKRYREADPTDEPAWRRAVGPRQHRPGHPAGHAVHRRHARRRHRRPPGAAASRPAIRRARSSRSSTTASTSAIRTSPSGRGRTRASRAAARRPTASTTTATATSTTSTAGTSATTTTPSTTSTRTATAPTSPGTIAASLDGQRRRRRRAGRLDHGPQVHRRRRRLRARLAGRSRAIDYAKSFGVRIVNASWGGAGTGRRTRRAVRRDPDLGDAVRGRGRQRRRRQRRRTRRRPCRRRSTCRTSCRSRRSTTPAGWPGSRTTAGRPSTSPRPAKGS